MTTATTFTVAVLSLMAVAAMLAFALGLLLGRRRNADRDRACEARGYEDGARTREQTAKLWSRARVGR